MQGLNAFNLLNQRTTRSNSNSNAAVSLADIKHLIETSKTAILKELQTETERITQCIDQLRRWRNRMSHCNSEIGK